ncbi:MAG: flagellar hook-basal body protein [Planctomycetota bacterium]|jgi:flagellar basal body rod protein FlgG
MNYGLYLSATGVLTNMHRQDVIANNIANVNTVGFKPDAVHIRQRLPERLEARAPTDPHRLLETLGGGHLINPTRITLRQGELIKTGNDLDLAIEGEGFLAVRGPGGGPDPVQLTRDGRLALNAQGELIMVTTGLRVLDVNDQPIRLDRARAVNINSNGDVLQDGRIRATIQITAPRDTDRLEKTGHNLLRIDAAGPSDRRPAGGRLLQGHVESSATNAILALNDLVKAAKSVQGNARMMQYHDHIMGQAVNTLGRVA